MDTNDSAAGPEMKKNLLVCFDAFGTIFKPRRPIFEQYREVARAHGVHGFTGEQLATSFKNAYKTESKSHPNFGKATDMGSDKWWTNVIENTFKPFRSAQGGRIPPGLAPALIHRFDSHEGYEIFPDVLSYLRKLSMSPYRQTASTKSQCPRIVVGVITNSDNRVPDILTSLGLKVHALRHGSSAQEHKTEKSGYDVDFVLMSYDVGHEKPDRRIFDAATKMLNDMLVADGDTSPDLEQWTRLYVGDELEKDAIGAMDAGWDALLVDRDDEHKDATPLSVEEKDDVAPRKLHHRGHEVVVLKNVAGFDRLKQRYPLLVQGAASNDGLE